MGEYSREQRNQLSRAIANSETGSKQLKQIIDNRMLFVEQMKFANSFSPKRESVLQRNAFFYKKPIAGPLVNHYHIGFDDFHTFSHLIHVYQPGENARLPNAISTNYSKDVGFGAKQGLSQSILDDEGELFTYYNGIQGAGGKAEKDPISTSPSEDAKLVSIINQIGTNNRYSLVGYNCQKWYKEVVDAFNKEKHNRDRLPILDRREIPKKIVTDHFFNRSMDAHYYGYKQKWDEKSPILDVVP